MTTSTMTIRLPSELKEQLDRLAETTERSKSWLTVDAIRSYLTVQRWQIQEIMAGLAEADTGDFADDDEVKAVFEKWRVDAR
ncbi:MAG: CopG family ribbon-helix-helix protein [Deltaproteobacteria bacterium]|nr:CopG family ribbon-helix-helix protein [Deltaproteobacteria bacterium]